MIIPQKLKNSNSGYALSLQYLQSFRMEYFSETFELLQEFNLIRWLPNRVAGLMLCIDMVE